jgi:hypothetical protein
MPSRAAAGGGERAARSGGGGAAAAPPPAGPAQAAPDEVALAAARRAFAAVHGIGPKEAVEQWRKALATVGKQGLPWREGTAFAAAAAAFSAAAAGSGNSGDDSSGSGGGGAAAAARQQQQAGNRPAAAGGALDPGCWPEEHVRVSVTGEVGAARSWRFRWPGGRRRRRRRPPRCPTPRHAPASPAARRQPRRQRPPPRPAPRAPRPAAAQELPSDATLQQVAGRLDHPYVRGMRAHLCEAAWLAWGPPGFEHLRPALPELRQVRGWGPPTRGQQQLGGQVGMCRCVRLPQCDPRYSTARAALNRPSPPNPPHRPRRSCWAPLRLSSWRDGRGAARAMRRPTSMTTYSSRWAQRGWPGSGRGEGFGAHARGPGGLGGGGAPRLDGAGRAPARCQPPAPRVRQRPPPAPRLCPRSTGRCCSLSWCWA